MAMWKTARKAAVAASAAVALLGTVPAEARAATPWYHHYITGPECPKWSVCIFPDPNYGIVGLRFYPLYGSTIYPCQGMRWEGSTFQDRVYSFKNFTSGSISFWNRAADGSYNYSRLGTFPSGAMIRDFTNGRLADAFVYDPRGDCKILTLDLYRNPPPGSAGVDAGQDDPGYGTRKVLKVDPGGATAKAVS